MCDTVVIVRPGGVLFAKASDRDPNEAQLVEHHPAREHPVGARLRCTHLEIPQARRTHAIAIARPFWTWGAEMGTNEHGVTIGNEAIFTRDPVPRTGLTGMDLVRLALERAESARAAVETILGLVQAHGQGGRAGLEQPGFRYFSSFLVADPREAFVLETAAGERHAIERVERVRAISNGLSVEPFCRENGDRLRTWGSRCRVRRARTEELAREARGPADLARALRDHGRGRRVPRHSPLTGAMDAACMHGGGLVASAQTVGAWIAELSPAGARHWVTATAGTCTSVFKPLDVHVPVDTGPTPTSIADERSLFWRHERLHRRAMRDPSLLLPRYAEERDALEARWFAGAADPRAAFREADRLEDEWAREVRAVRVADARPPWARRYWAARDARAGLAP